MSKSTDKRKRRSCAATVFISAGVPPIVTHLVSDEWRTVFYRWGLSRDSRRLAHFICHTDVSSSVFQPARQQLNFAGGSPPDVQPKTDPGTPLRVSRHLAASGATQQQYKLEKGQPYHPCNGDICSSKIHRTQHGLNTYKQHQVTFHFKNLK